MTKRTNFRIVGQKDTIVKLFNPVNMENYFLLEKETYARHIGIPAAYLKNFVITERNCGGHSMYGFGIKIDTGRARQNNMFYDILKHKIAETSFRIPNAVSGLHRFSSAQSCRIYRAELKTENGMIILETPYRQKFFEMPYEELEALYQEYIFSERDYINEGKLNENFWLDPLYYARHFNVPIKWFSWRMKVDLAKKAILPLLFIKDKDCAISLYEGRIISVKEKETIRVKGNNPVRMLKGNGEEGLVLISMDSNALPDMETEIKLELDEEILKKLYHDRWYTPVMRPQVHYYE